MLEKTVTIVKLSPSQALKLWSTVATGALQYVILLLTLVGLPGTQRFSGAYLMCGTFVVCWCVLYCHSKVTAAVAVGFVRTGDGHSAAAVQRKCRQLSRVMDLTAVLTAVWDGPHSPA